MCKREISYQLFRLRKNGTDPSQKNVPIIRCLFVNIIKAAGTLELFDFPENSCR